jgi:S1-C subfamily serine protease
MKMYSQFHGVEYTICTFIKPTSGLSDTQSSASNTFVSQFTLPSLFAKNEKSIVSIIATFPTVNSSEVNSSNIQNSSSNISNNQSHTLGTGFVYDTQGHIITTDSIIADSHLQEVEFMDGTIYKAEVIGSDPYSDIAVLLVKGVPENKLKPVEFINNSSDVQVGEQAATIGTSGVLNGLLSDGIISGMHKTIYLQSIDEDALPYAVVDAIVSTVVTNNGSIGAPLFNIKGEVIGINTVVSSLSKEYAGFSVAASSNTIQKEVPQIISTGTYEHPWLGIAGIDLTPDMISALGLNNTETKGVIVALVDKGSPAELAGLTNGTSENNVYLGNNESANSDADIIVG